MIVTERAVIRETNDFKLLSSPSYNYSFFKASGYFKRWGATPDQDPQAGLPEIADIEITTSCNGVRGVLCPWCYKGNTPKGTYMPFETFKLIHSKLPRSVTQIAFGVDAQCRTNPEWLDIFKYCRSNTYNFVVPNVTIADIDDVTAQSLRVCGAVAVSRYADKNACYDSVKRLTDLGMKQVNIHIMVSEETYDNVLETIKDRTTDPRLDKLNAIVLLSLKQKGRGVHHTPLSQEKFKYLVDMALEHNVSIGFDSCTCPKFLEAIKGRRDYTKFEQMAEPCESTCFSVYIDVHGDFYPCSFLPGTPGWETGISVLTADNFLRDVWYHPRTVEFRRNLISGGRKCPVFKI